MSKMNVGDRQGESFWTVRGVRQGCPPSLFTLLLADVEEMFEGNFLGTGVGEELRLEEGKFICWHMRMI